MEITYSLVGRKALTAKNETCFYKLLNYGEHYRVLHKYKYLKWYPNEGLTKQYIKKAEKYSNVFDSYLKVIGGVYSELQNVYSLNRLIKYGVIVNIKDNPVYYAIATISWARRLLEEAEHLGRSLEFLVEDGGVDIETAMVWTQSRPLFGNSYNYSSHFCYHIHDKFWLTYKNGPKLAHIISGKYNSSYDYPIERIISGNIDWVIDPGAKFIIYNVTKSEDKDYVLEMILKGEGYVTRYTSGAET